MKSGIFIFLCFWIQWGTAQNYQERALDLVKHFQQKPLSAADSMLLDTIPDYFQSTASDTTVFLGLNAITAKTSLDSLADAFNDLCGEFAKYKIAQSENGNTRIYQQYLAGYYLNAASSLAIKKQLQAALKLRYKALGIYTQLHDTALMVKTRIKLGIDHFNAKDFEQSEKWYQEAIYLMGLQGDSLGILRIQESIGAILSAKGDHEGSIPYFQASLGLAIKEQNYPAQAQIQYLMGRALTQLERYAEAQEALEASLAIFNNFNFDMGISVVETSLADMFIKQGNWKKARQHGTRSFELAQKHQIKQTISRATFNLHTIYKAENNYVKSLEMLELYTQLKDSLEGEANTKALLEQRLQFEYEQQAKLDSIHNAAALSVQIEENKRRKTNSYFLIGGLILTGIFAFVLYSRFRIIKKQRNQLDFANEKLTELDQSKSRFFTNISHEFRTPLTVISGMADMVSDPEPRELIKRNSQSLLSLVNQILDLRKLESGNLLLNMVQGDIIPFLNYLLESFHSYAEAKGVELSFSTDTESLNLDYDPEKMYSITTNLLSNAIKYTPEGGKVGLVVSGSSFLDRNAGTEVKKQQAESRNFYTITISDNGIGIPAGQLGNIFNRFYQVDDSSTRAGEGTGIGLTLTQELTKLMGGEISVESEEGKGTTFFLKFPISQLASPQADASDGRPVAMIPASGLLDEMPVGTAAAPYKLLIVEDNVDVARYLQTSLNDLYQIRIARNGEEGIEIALAEVPDIIISDVMMPIKNGFELCETLKRDERTSHIPIILLTAKADVESRIIGLKRGADAYLAKPFDKKELLTRLEMLIKLRQQLQTRYQTLELVQPVEDIGIQLEDAFIMKLNDQIFAHLSDTDINVQSICTWMGMSRTPLHNKLKALTGMSTTQYLRSVRLNEAKKMLLNSDLRISDIAYKVGFNDPAYFSNMFTKVFGSSPREARKGLN